MFIEDLHNQIIYLRNTVQGRYESPEEIDRIINHVQQDVFFEEEFSKYQVTKRVSDFMAPFQRTVRLKLTGGFAALPDDYVHLINHQAVFVQPAKEVNMQFINEGEWIQKKNAKLIAPSDDFPICRLGKGFIEVSPITVPYVDIHYLRRPAAAVWAYTVSGDGRTLVFDSANAVDLEWPQAAQGMLLEKILSHMGTSLRDQDLVQFEAFRKQIDGRQ